MAHALDSGILIGPQISLEDWADLSEDITGEVVNGRLVEEEMPDYAHEVIVAFLARALGVWSDASGALVGTSDARFAIAPDAGRKPDLTVFFAGRRPPRRGLIRIPPDLAVEVLSVDPRDERRDRVEKRAEYARFGIAWYWIVDPEHRALEIFELVGPDYRLVLNERSGLVTAVPGCPGLGLDLDAMWRKLDELGD